MNRDQFISWLKGFTAAVEIQPTERQWDTIVSELDKIQECTDWSSPISDPNIFPKWQEPHHPNPWDKYKITCDGTGINNAVLVSGSVNTQGIITNGNTSTTTKLPKYSNLNYTLKDDSKDN